MSDFWEEGLISERTKCWAQGLDGWKPLRSIAQLKWTLPCSSGTALLNETDLSILILNMLVDICSFYPNREEDGGFAFVSVLSCKLTNAIIVKCDPRPRSAE